MEQAAAVATMDLRLSTVPKKVRASGAQGFSTGLKMPAQKSNQQRRQKET